MRILHTADWHIGQRLHERQRIDEHKEFLNWLLNTIKEQKVDILLVSGDIFDTALPSAEATNLYYSFLFQLFNETGAYTVIIAGNHDSPRHLDAPREFLKMGRIHVIGLTNEPAECVVEIPSESPKIAIAAVPYLSENELPHVSYESEIEKQERYRERLKSFYQDCVSNMSANIPKILMGHLYVHGGTVGDSERNIQIGGATAIRPNDFPDNVDYVALGHLHRPQSIKGKEYPIKYAGSPIPLRFNETTYKKQVFLLETYDDRNLRQVDPIDIPVFKELCIVEGDDNHILSQAMTETWNEKYIQVKLKLDSVRTGVADEIRKAFSDRGGDVLTVELQMQNEGERPNIDVEDMKQPEEIFDQFCQTQFGKPPDETLKQTFTELMEMIEVNE